MMIVDFTNTQRRRTQKERSIITTQDNHSFRRERNRYYDGKTNSTRTCQWVCTTPGYPERCRQIFRLDVNGELEDENIFDFIAGPKSFVPSTSTMAQQVARNYVADQAAALQPAI